MQNQKVDLRTSKEELSELRTGDEGDASWADNKTGTTDLSKSGYCVLWCQARDSNETSYIITYLHIACSLGNVVTSVGLSRCCFGSSCGCSKDK